MKNKIERTLFWFNDGKTELHHLTSTFFGISHLLNSLINQFYSGRNIKFININFATEETYELFPTIPPNYIHYYAGMGGHLQYHGIIDFNIFYNLNKNEQQHYIWERVYKMLKEAAMKIKNDSLLLSVEYAYKKGLEKNLNPDYRIIKTEVVLYEKTYIASIWLNFLDNGMEANFTIEINDKTVYRKHIDNTENGVEFFLEIFKKIEQKNNTIIIKGHGNIKYFPIKITITKDMLDGIPN